MTDRIVVLDAGQVVEEGLSQRVSSVPQSLTARRLVEAAPAFAASEDAGSRSPAATPKDATEAGAT